MLAGALSTIVQLEAPDRLHAASMQSNSAMHRQAVGRAVLHAQEAAELDRSLHERASRRAATIFSETRSYEAELERREIARDRLQQKNNVIQTLMLVNTVMIISIYSLLVQGYATASHPDWLREGHTLAFTILCSLSVVSHLASVFLAFKLNARTIQFQMHNPKARYRPCGQRHDTFNDFFSCHCGLMERVSVLLFGVGASLALATCACFVWTVDLGRGGNRNLATTIACLVIAVVGTGASIHLYYILD
jgi:hypothetical protein